jgi:hypothetical protein
MLDFTEDLRAAEFMPRETNNEREGYADCRINIIRSESV